MGDEAINREPFSFAINLTGMSIRMKMLCLISKPQQPMKRDVASCLTHINFTQRVPPVN